MTKNGNVKEISMLLVVTHGMFVLRDRPGQNTMLIAYGRFRHYMLSILISKDSILVGGSIFFFHHPSSAQ